MAFLFKRNPKTPAELVRVLNDQVAKFDTANDKRKVQDECTRYLNQVRSILYGNEEENIHSNGGINISGITSGGSGGDNNGNSLLNSSSGNSSSHNLSNLTGTGGNSSSNQIIQLAQEVYSTDCLYLLVLNLINLSFDSRKDVAILFSSLLRIKSSTSSASSSVINPPVISAVDYLLSRPKILQVLFKGPEIPEITLIAGQIIRDCIKFPQINKYLLNDKIFWNYFRYCTTNSFENSTDSFSTLNSLLTTNKKIVSDWLSVQNNVDYFIISMNSLIKDGNYVNKRQSIKLLSQLILQKQNNNLMRNYIGEAENLKIIMNLLSDKSRNLQFEAFQVFKVFVANPKKSKPILDILIKNRDKLLLFLENFEPIDNGRRDEQLFIEERDFVIHQIQQLPRISKGK